MPIAWRNNNAGDIKFCEAGASHVATKPHVIMVIRRVKTCIEWEVALPFDG